MNKIYMKNKPRFALQDHIDLAKDFKIVRRILEAKRRLIFERYSYSHPITKKY